MYKLDLTHHVVLQLGANRGVWKHIDFIYSKKELDYYKAYRNSKMFGDMIFLSLCQYHMVLMTVAV